jgi:AP-1 complex subunit gamma-1
VYLAFPPAFFPSLRFSQGDLLGDEITNTSAPSSNGGSALNAQSNQDLLAEIFGSSPAPPTSSAPAAGQGIAPSTAKKSAVEDILGLFGSTPTGSGTPLPEAAAPPPSAFSLSQSQSPPAQAPPKLQSYTAYEKEELKITLTPQTSAQRPGMVNVMVRFQVTGSNVASGVNFQVAVPKVNFR